MKLLLMSNARLKDMDYLEYTLPELKVFLEGKKNIVFVPYARITISYDDYEKKVNNALSATGHQVTSIHHGADPKKAVEDADAIIIGGGNTWVLTDLLHKKGLVDVIHKKVSSGMPYAGWSAGAMVTCPTIQTNNGMAIVQPQSFKGLNLVPFQINAHYPVKELEDHFGETRADRLNEYVIANPKTVVAGIEEGMMFHVENGKISLRGVDRQCHIFKNGQPVKILKKGDDLSFLLS